MSDKSAPLRIQDMTLLSSHRIALAMLIACAIPSATAQTVLNEDKRLIAPGVISTGDDEWGLTLSPDSNTILFNKADRGYSIQVIMEATRGRDGQWRSPRVASFSGQYRDIDPAFSPDGRYLIFASNRPVDPDGARKTDFDLWRVDRQSDGTWGSPRHLGDAVNSTGSETNSSITADGTLYFATSDRAGVLGQRDLMRAKPTRTGYEAPEPLSAPINSEFDESNHWIAPDESYLLFLSNRPGGFAASDLYISFRSANGWTMPKNIGPRLNRQGASGVFTPFVDTRGTLYFAERDTQWQPLPDAPLSTDALETYLRGPRNGQGDLYSIPWSVDAYR